MRREREEKAAFSEKTGFLSCPGLKWEEGRIKMNCSGRFREKRLRPGVKGGKDMTFSSLAFLFLFFPVTFLLYALIRSHTARNTILAAASLVFYAFGEPVAVMIMLVSIVLNYLFGLGASGTKWDKPAVILAVLLNIGLLAAYKYTGFLVEIFDSVTGLAVPVPHIRLPIGISFFTFQGLSYVVDVYRDKKNVQRSLFSVLPYLLLPPAHRRPHRALFRHRRPDPGAGIQPGPGLSGRLPFPFRLGEKGADRQSDGFSCGQGLWLSSR